MTHSSEPEAEQSEHGALHPNDIENEVKKDIESIIEEATKIGHHYASLPVLDGRSPDELLGYDEWGLPN